MKLLGGGDYDGIPNRIGGEKGRFIADMMKESVGKNRERSLAELRDIVDVMMSEGKGKLRCLVLAHVFEGDGKREFLGMLRGLNVIYDEKNSRVEKQIGRVRVILFQWGLKIMWTSTEIPSGPVKIGSDKFLMLVESVFSSLVSPVGERSEQDINIRWRK